MRLKSVLVVSTMLACAPMVASAQFAEITPIPQTVTVNTAKAALGEKLYNDTKLSGDGKVSCATCHALHKGGTDQLTVSKGIKGQNGPINAPTVFNSEHNFVQFWDGRAKDLAEQAAGPVANPLEMGDSWTNVEAKIKADPDYAAAFKEVYGGKISKETITDAIAEFERTLITPNSRFDQFLRGDEDALSDQEKEGYALFKEKGCNTCHNGPYLGGNSYQQLSPEYLKRRIGKMTDADLGRYNVTKKEEDKHKFKVPMLRNVAMTQPYFHDGKVKTLDLAVKNMAKYQLGQDLNTREVQSIVAFLKSLTGEYKGEPLDNLKAK